MPLTCQQLKTEYDRYASDKQALTSLYMRVISSGALAKLSEDDRRNLIRLKDSLKAEREALIKKLESPSAAYWKKALFGIEANRPDSGEFCDQTVSQLIRQDRFKRTLIDIILFDAQRGQTDRVSAWNAVTGLSASLSLNLLDQDSLNRIKTQIQTESFKQTLTEDILTRAQGGQTDRGYAWNAVIALAFIRRIVIFHLKNPDR